MSNAPEAVSAVSAPESHSASLLESLRNSQVATSVTNSIAEMGLLNAIVTHIAPVFIVTSPITSYADQIYSIYRTRTSAGFSLDIPLIMLAASILKLFYWIGARFALSLLLQAILMIFVQVLLLQVALTYRPPLSHLPFQQQNRRPYDFWQWKPTRPYWTFITSFTAALSVLQLLFGGISAYTTIQGYVALATEAMLPFPQLLSNYRRKSCKGFRFSVLANWLIGDAFKMWYFFASGSGEGGVPWAFKIGGAFQACCDCGLGIQYWMYGEGPEQMGRGYEMEGRASHEKIYE